MTFVCATVWRWTLTLARIRALIWAGWTVLGFATIGQFLLEGPRALGLGWARIAAADALSDAVRSQTGALLIARFVVLLLTAAVIHRTIRHSVANPSEIDRPDVAMLVAGSAALAVTVATLGHAGVGDDSWLATPVTAIHLLAMAVWIGGLITLVAAVLPKHSAENLRQWSRMAFICVCTLVLTGEYQAWRQVHPVEAMWSTTYGITLTLKLALVLAMLTLAYIAQRDLAPHRLRCTVPAEAVVGVAVIAVTTVLVSQPPARDTYGPPVSLVAPLDARSAAVHITSTRRGPTSIEVTTVDAHGSPVNATSMKGTLSSVDANIAALAVPFSAAPGNAWQSTYAVVPRAGWWTLTLTVEFSSSQAIVTSTHFRVW